MAAADAHRSIVCRPGGAGFASLDLAHPGRAVARPQSTQMGRPNLAQQSAAFECTRLAELCRLPPTRPLLFDRFDRGGRRHLHRDHVCVAEPCRYGAVAGRLLRSLLQCAVVDLCPPLAAPCTLAMDASWARSLHSAS